MPTERGIPIIVGVPWGRKRRHTLWISGTDFTDHMTNFTAVKKLNQMSSFSGKLYGISGTDKSIIKEDNEVMFFYDNELVIKGEIKKADYQSYRSCAITGYGMEAKLWKRGVDRSDWVDSGTATIVAELCSENLDGGSPWIVETGTNTNWGNITMRGHFDNRLRVISDMAKVCESGTKSYDWWVDQKEEEAYNTNYMNFAPYRGSETSVKTFDTRSNARIVFHKKDTENMVNDVVILGYGDGVNQISGCAEDATSISTYGRKRKTFVDRSLVNSNVAGSVAARYLEDLKDPIERIRLEAANYHFTGVDVGDKVTVKDKDVFPGAGSAFRVVGMQRTYDRFPKLTYELSNKSLTFIEELASAEQKVEKMGTYAKGSTDSFQIVIHENCDASNPLYVRFFVPSDVIRIVSANLAFKMRDYRTYTATSAASAGGSPHTHDMTFEISGTTLTSPVVTISGGEEGFEAGVGQYTSDQDAVDVTSVVQPAGAWTNVEFTPNKKMRIEANIYVKEFIESK